MGKTKGKEEGGKDLRKGGRWERLKERRKVGKNK